MNPGGATETDPAGVAAGSSATSRSSSAARAPGDVERRAPVRPGELHGQVRRRVAVLGVGRPLDLDLDGLVAGAERRERARGDRCRPGTLDRDAKLAAEGRVDGRGHGGSWALVGCVPHRSRCAAGRAPVRSRSDRPARPGRPATPASSRTASPTACRSCPMRMCVSRTRPAPESAASRPTSYGVEVLRPLGDRVEPERRLAQQRVAGPDERAQVVHVPAVARVDEARPVAGRHPEAVALLGVLDPARLEGERPDPPDARRRRGP